VVFLMVFAGGDACIYIEIKFLRFIGNTSQFPLFTLLDFRFLSFIRPTGQERAENYTLPIFLFLYIHLSGAVKRGVCKILLNFHPPFGG